MAKAIAVKGLAAAGLAPANGAAAPKAVVFEAPKEPPAKAAPKRPGRPSKRGATLPGDVQCAPPPGDGQPVALTGDARLVNTSAAQPAKQFPLAPKPKQALERLCDTLAEATGLEARVVKKVLKLLSEAAAKDLRDHDVFRLPNLVLFRRKKTAARAEKTKKAFGKDIYVAAKPAGHKITAYVVKQLKDAVTAE